MNQILPLEGLYLDLSVIAGQVIGIILIMGVLYSVLYYLLRRVKALPFLARYESTMALLRRNIRILLFIVGALLCLGVIAFDGYLMFTGQDVYGYYVAQIENIPADFWQTQLINLGKVVGLIILVWLVNKPLVRLFQLLATKTRAFEQIRANDESITTFFESLNKIRFNVLVLFVVAAATSLFGLPQVVSNTLYTGLRIYLIVALGLLFVKAVAVLVESLDALSVKYSTSSNILGVYERFRGLVPLLRRSLEYVIYIFVATLVLLQVEAVAPLAKYGPRIVQVIGIFFLSRVVVEFVEYLVDRSMTNSEKVDGVALQRQLTLVPLIKSVLRYLVYFGAFVLMLGALELNPGPVLAGAGLVGLVVGLGAQPLINDVVSGFFILFENLFLVGDYIETGSARGVVEAIDIRTTRIRDPNGQQHILRNGQLNEIINYSKKFTFAVVEVGVAYDSNLEQVYDVLREVGAALQAQNSDVLAQTEVQGLEAFGASELLIRTVTRVKPGQHAQVAREYRFLVKEYFDRHNIEIPFTQHVVTLQHKPDDNNGE